MARELGEKVDLGAVQGNPYRPSESTLNTPDAVSAAVVRPPGDRTPRWFTRLLAIFGIGGGALGLAIAAWFAIRLPPSLGHFFFVLAISGYAFGIVCGVAALRRSRRYLNRNAWFYWLQLPVLSSPAFGYSFAAGAQVVVGFAPPRLIGNFYLGSTFQFWVGGEAPLVVGINLVAIVMLVLIHRMKARLG